MSDEPKDTIIGAFTRLRDDIRSFWRKLAEEIVYNGGWRWFLTYGTLVFLLILAWTIAT